MLTCTICGSPLLKRTGKTGLVMSERARLTEVCDECYMLGRTLDERQGARLDKAQWLAVIDMLADTAPYGPDTLQKLLDRYQDQLGGFEPWRTWALQHWQERFKRKAS
ncbi:MAG TPA: hypothetical protein VGP82_00470 [Ktedonobacterales bacterium]|nr:hypothetical protein [Ktedonobacterales bacterium]